MGSLGDPVAVESYRVRLLETQNILLSPSAVSRMYADVLCLRGIVRPYHATHGGIPYG